MTKGKGKAAKDSLGASPTHLLHRALQLALDYHAAAAGSSAVTQRQFTVLAAASGAEGLTQNDLVRATGIDRSTLADLVARLLAKGLLSRERSSTDGRANSVRLSFAGRTALDLASNAAATGDKNLLAILSPKKRETFVKILGLLAAAADAGPATAPIKPREGDRPTKGSGKKKHGKASRKRDASAADDAAL